MVLLSNLPTRLRLGSADVNSATAYHDNLNVSDQPLSHLLVLHSNEAKAATRPRVRVSHYLHVADLAKLRELGFEITFPERVVKAADKEALPPDALCLQPFSLLPSPILISRARQQAQLNRWLRSDAQYLLLLLYLSLLSGPLSLKERVRRLRAISGPDLNVPIVYHVRCRRVEHALVEGLNRGHSALLESDKGKASTLAAMLVPHYCDINNVAKLLEVPLDFVLYCINRPKTYRVQNTGYRQ